MNQYIITEEERKKMLMLLSVIQHNACHTLALTIQDAYNLMENIRSHPYNPKVEREKILVDTNHSWDWCLNCPRESKCMLNLTFEQCQEISKKEREKVLDEVISLINRNCFELEGKRLRITLWSLLQEIDKLRQEGKEEK